MKKTLLTVLIATAALSAHADTLTNGLMAYYPLDGNGNDASGNGRNLTISNCSFTNGTRTSGLYYFPPTTTYHVESNSYVYYSGTPQTITNFTYSIWINPGVLYRPNDRLMFLFGQGKDWSSSLVLRMNPSTSNSPLNTLWLGTGRPADNVYYKSPIISQLNTNVWQHLVTTVQGKTYKFYLNGTEVIRVTNPPAAFLNLDLNNYSIASEPTGQYPFQGSIDEVRIYNRALSSNEVVSLYNLDRRLPTLVYNLTAVTSGADPTGDFPQYTYKGYFLYNQSTLNSATIELYTNSMYYTYSIGDGYIDYHATKPYIGGVSCYSGVQTSGTYPNINKSILWITGKNASNNLGSGLSITVPTTLTGFENGLSLSAGTNAGIVSLINGTSVGSVALTLKLDTNNTAYALTNNETFSATVTRLTNSIKTNGYSLAPPNWP